MAQERLSNLTILAIEYEIACNIDYDDVINNFAKKKQGVFDFLNFA